VTDFTYILDNGNERDCGWLTKNNEVTRISNYCGRVHVRFGCPATCLQRADLVCECQDDVANYSFVNDVGVSVSCSWLTEDPSQIFIRRDDFCIDDDPATPPDNPSDIGRNCVRSCGFCRGTFTSGVTISSEPSTIVQPSSVPSYVPSLAPSVKLSDAPSGVPQSAPSVVPSGTPNNDPSQSPSVVQSDEPSVLPSNAPSVLPSDEPSVVPNDKPSSKPSLLPSTKPSTEPSRFPSVKPSGKPSSVPSVMPSQNPSDTPSAMPSRNPSFFPSVSTTLQPSSFPSTTNCADASVTDFTYILDNGNERDCGWLTKNNEVTRISNYCGRVHVRFGCPATCLQRADLVCECQDDVANYSFVNDVGVSVSCSWLTEDPSQIFIRRDDFCIDDDPATPPDNPSDIGRNCVRSCGFCRGTFTSGVTISSEPSTIVQPSSVPSYVPSLAPSVKLSDAPSGVPQSAPSVMPSGTPNNDPSQSPSVVQSDEPSFLPSAKPSVLLSDKRVYIHQMCQVYCQQMSHQCFQATSLVYCLATSLVCYRLISQVFFPVMSRVCCHHFFHQ
jgi:Uncharacterized protein conserved in bacteria